MADVSTSYILHLKGHLIEGSANGEQHQVVLCDNEAWSLYQALRVFFDRSLLAQDEDIA